MWSKVAVVGNATAYRRVVHGRRRCAAGASSICPWPAGREAPGPLRRQFFPSRHFILQPTSHQARAGDPESSPLLAQRARPCHDVTAPGGTAWSVPGGGARSEQARHRAPAGAAAPWLARWAPEVVSPYGLKPRTASQSPCQAPTCGCLLAGACLRVASSWSPTARAWSGKMFGSCPWPAPAVDTGSSRVFARTNKSKANSPAQPRTHQSHPTYKCFL